MLSSPAQPGPVRLTRHSRVSFRPAGRAAITGGFWAERRRVNRQVTVPSGWDRLHEAGNFAQPGAGRWAGLRRVLHDCGSWTVTCTSGWRPSGGR